MAPVLIDITEMVMNPVLSGAQRLVCSLIKYLPTSLNLEYVYFDDVAHKFRKVPVRILEMLKSNLFATSLNEKDLRSYVRNILSSTAGPTLEVEPFACVFAPEIFYNMNRIRFYESLRRDKKVRDLFIVFDFIPWLNPASLAIMRGFGAASMPYIQLLKTAAGRLFISDSTHETYHSRISRGLAKDEDIVIPLGADGWSLPRQNFGKAKRAFSCIGAFDGKKGQELIYDAFSVLAQHNKDLEMHFFGSIPSNPDAIFHSLLSDGDPRLHIHGRVNDDVILDILAITRATFFISQNEGFGLPALESLYLGIPTVVSSDLPALAHIADGGQIRLPEVTMSSILDAMRLLENDAEAEKLWTVASALRLPKWDEFAAKCADWLSGFVRSSSGSLATKR